MIRLGLEDYRPAREEKRAITLSDFPWLQNLWGGTSSSGVVVNETTALNFSAYFCGVNIIASQIGITPLIPYRRTDNDDRERATTHPTYRVLHVQPNPCSTPAVFWQTLMGHVLTWGNGYAEIEYDNALRPIALWTITPDKMEPKLEALPLANGAYTYRMYYMYAGKRRIEAEDVIHVPGLGFDGVRGYSVIEHARRSLGLGLAYEQFGSSFLSRGATPAVTIEHPKALSPKAKANIREAWDNENGGPFQAGGTVVLEEGMKANVLGIPQKDAQFLEGREYQIEEVARWLNISPYHLKAKFGAWPGGTPEMAQISLLTDTLDPWYVAIAQEVTRKLFPANQLSTYYAEHLVDARLRLDAATRLSIQRGYFDMGVLTAEQIAKQQNLPKPEPKPDPPPPPPPENDGRILSAQRGLVLDAAARFAEREADEVKRVARKGAAGLGDWLEQQHAKRAALLTSILVPAVRVILAHTGAKAEPLVLAGRLAGAYLQRSREELLSLPPNGIEAAADRLVSGWLRTRPDELAEAVLGYRDEERN